MGLLENGPGVSRKGGREGGGVWWRWWVLEEREKKIIIIIIMALMLISYYYYLLGHLRVLKQVGDYLCLDNYRQVFFLTRESMKLKCGIL